MSDIENADLEWLANGTPRSRQFDDIYFSSEGGPEESEHVYIRGNDLETRWRKTTAGDRPFVIAELGFGTGLNFLLCQRLLDNIANANLYLHYVAFEKHPLTITDIGRVHSLWPQLKKYSTLLRQQIIDHTSGLHRFHFDNKVTLDLYFGEALTGMSDLFSERTEGVDCWFMDGFSPAKNPALWNADIIKIMWQYSKTGATASTYSVAGQIRRSLQNAGFKIDRLPGFGNKREMLVAHKNNIGLKREPGQSTNTTSRPAWFNIKSARYTHRRAIIIGAGLAGCSTAHALTQKGWHVTLIESAPNIAAGASGNPQAILQPRLSVESSSQSTYYLHALLYANRQFRQIQKRTDIGWHPDGIIRTPEREMRSGLWQRPALPYASKILTRLTAQQASELAGISLASDAIFLPHGGWLRPALLCQAYLDRIANDQLYLISGQSADTLYNEKGHWQVINNSGVIASAPVVILCNSYRLNTFSQTSFLPLIPIRGQMTITTGNSRSSALKRPLVAGKYLCPADFGHHSIGATYQSGNTDTAVKAEDDDENITGIDSAFPATMQLGLSAIGARASIRCNATDYFPIVGAVPDYEDFISVFGALGRNADAQIKQQARYQPGLYLNTGHGSYGLTSCPLASEYLASLITCESIPVTNAIADSLSPARFIIRELKRQRVPVNAQKSIRNLD